MVSGNLAAQVSMPQMQALSGPAGVSLQYNSMSSSLATGGGNYGLNGSYYTDDGSHDFSGMLAGPRTDPDIDQSWTGSSPPTGGLNPAQPFIVKWAGELTLPVGTWELGGLSTGGMRVSADGSQVYDNWSGTPGMTVPSFGTPVITGPAQVPVEVDDWDSWSYGQAVVQLWADNTAVTDPAQEQGQFLVQPGWLTPAATGVPPGWSLQPGGGVQWTSLTDQGDQAVLTSTGGDTVTFTRASDGSYLTPPGDTDYLTSSGGSDGSLVLSTSGGHVYTFGPDGSLASMSTATDSLHPAALHYTYTGTLLTAVTDPVSGRQVSLGYGGSCPAGMLCTITYWDGSSTTLSYDGNGQIAAVSGPGGQVTEFGYDSQDRLARIRDALAAAYVEAGGQAGAASGCPAGTTGVSAYAVETQICYDARGRVAFIAEPAPAPAGTSLRPARTYTYSEPLVTAAGRWPSTTSPSASISSSFCAPASYGHTPSTSAAPPGARCRSWTRSVWLCSAES